MRLMGNPALYRLLLESISDGVYSIDTDRRITYWNKGAERLAGYTAEEVMGRRCRDGLLVHTDKDGNPICQESCPMAACMGDGEGRAVDAFIHHKDGHHLPVSLRVSPLRDEQGKIIGAVQAFNGNASHDLVRQRLEQLEEMALLDELTHVGNRRHAESSLSGRISDFERYGWTFGLLFLDLDYFKWVNDMHGHQVGDKVLQMVANTLSGVLRTSDVIARWGGEEFVVLLSNCDPERLYRIANRLLNLVRRSFVMDGEAIVQVSLSIGGTLVRSGDTPASIVERADTLMYASKSHGRNCVTTDSWLPVATPNA